MYSSKLLSKYSGKNPEFTNIVCVTTRVYHSSTFIFILIMLNRFFSRFFCYLCEQDCTQGVGLFTLLHTIIVD